MNIPIVLDIQDIANQVQRKLDIIHPGGSNLTVLSSGIRQDQEWWYVPVKPDVAPPTRYEYYEALGKVEQQLLTENGLIVLFIPVQPD